MGNTPKVAMMITVEKEYRDQLRTMAAKSNLEDPSRTVNTASGIARDIICSYLDDYMQTHDLTNSPKKED